MAAAANGMALHGGIIPYVGTFFVFSDYLRPALRLGAIMRQRVIYVLTHDSIGLGEDGPTHQPVEHLASLRAMPNLHVFRPGDAMETAECWELAIAPDGRAEPAGAVAAGAAGVADGYDGEPLRARRLRAGGSGGPAPGDHHRHRIGGADRHGGAGEAGGRRHRGRRRVAAVLGVVCRSRTRPTAPRCWAARRGSALRPPAASAGSSGSGRTARSSG